MGPSRRPHQRPRGRAIVVIAPVAGRWFNLGRFREHGINATFVQDNHSRSAPGVLRGLHYQHAPAQGKLIGVVRGRIWDVVVDIRPGSATFGDHAAVELSDINGRMLWLPAGFAHGLRLLGSEPADLLYKVDAPYHPPGEGGIQWNDPHLAIQWPIDNPVISARDASMGSFAAYAGAPPSWNSPPLAGARSSGPLAPGSWPPGCCPAATPTPSAPRAPPPAGT